MKSKASILYEHPLVAKLLDKSKPLISDDFVAKIGTLKPGEKIATRYPINEYYVYKVLKSVFPLIETIDKLELVEFYLRKSGKTGKLGGHKVTEWNWLEYNISYFAVLYSSLPDKALILIDAVYGLGNHEKNCRPAIVRQNIRLEDSASIPALEKIEALSKKLSEERNLHVHRGNRIDLAKIFESVLLDRLHLFHSVEKLGHPVLEPKLLRALTLTEKQSLLKRLSTWRRDMEQAVYGLLTALDSVYIDQLNRVELLAKHEVPENVAAKSGR